MQVVLIQDVDKLGKAGDVVIVKDGYGRNFLIPRKLAMPATPQNLKFLQLKKKAEEQRAGAELKAAQELAARLQAISCTIACKAGADEQLFGEVTPAEIAEALEAEGIKVDKRKIEILETIRKVGVYNVSVRLHPEVNQKLKVWVVKE